MTTPRLQRVFAAATLVVASTLFSLAGLELALRTYHAMRPAPAAPPPAGFFWELQPAYGWLHLPNREGFWFNAYAEFKASVRINSKGLRDVEHEYAKPPGVFRILLLGDSYMEAMQVELEQSFARLLEATLNSSGRRVEVINAGVADWGTDNELLYFREEGHKYSPDLVLLAFTTANDVRNNSVVLNRRARGSNLHKPTFTRKPDGSLEQHPPPPLPAPPPPPPPPPWWRHFNAITFLVDRLPHDVTVKFAGTNGDPQSPPVETFEAAPDMVVHAPEYTPEVREAWQITKALLAQLRLEVEQRHARFAVFLVNAPWAHYDEAWERMLAGRPGAKQTWIRRRPNDELGMFLWNGKVPSVDLFSAFEAAKEERPLFFRLDAHWTPAGHRLAAATVAQFLVEQNLVPAPTPDVPAH